MVVASRLVGRSAEVEVIDRALGRLRQGYGSALAVLGDAGIGKTRLLQEAASRATHGEVVVLGSASEFDGAMPYGALVSALDQLFGPGRAADPLVLADLDADQHAALARVVPSYPVRP